MFPKEGPGFKAARISNWVQPLGLLKMPANQSIRDLILSFEVSSEKSPRRVPHRTQLSASEKDEGFTNYAAELLRHEHVRSRQNQEMGQFSEIPWKTMHSRHTEEDLLAEK